MAIFNFPIKIEQHAEMAMTAALDIQRHCKAALAALAARFSATPDKVGIGVGIHSGQVEIGEFSTVRSDFTAIGGTVNMAARLESKAAAGEILVSSESAALTPRLVTKSTRSLALKGIEHPVLAMSRSWRHYRTWPVVAAQHVRPKRSAFHRMGARQDRMATRSAVQGQALHHISPEFCLRRRTGINAIHVPFRGAANHPAMLRW